MLYLVFDDNERLVGLLNIRYDLTDELRNLYGDIGYGVRPSERRKGYATEMVKYAKQICKEKEMAHIIIGCYNDNYGSKKTIAKNGGYLIRNDVEEKIISDEWKIKLQTNYYRIDL